MGCKSRARDEMSTPQPCASGRLALQGAAKWAPYPAPPALGSRALLVFLHHPQAGGPRFGPFPNQLQAQIRSTLHTWRQEHHDTTRHDRHDEMRRFGAGWTNHLAPCVRRTDIRHVVGVGARHTLCSGRACARIWSRPKVRKVW